MRFKCKFIFKYTIIYILYMLMYKRPNVSYIYGNAIIVGSIDHFSIGQNI